MISARRHFFTDDLDDAIEDFEDMGVVSRDKRPVGTERPTKAYTRRLIKLEAIAILKRAGWSSERIAAAVERSDRQVRRRVSLCREIAEARGRV
jgi:hypothetical protein